MRKKQEWDPTPDVETQSMFQESPKRESIFIWDKISVAAVFAGIGLLVGILGGAALAAIPARSQHDLDVKRIVAMKDEVKTLTQERDAAIDAQAVAGRRADQCKAKADALTNEIAAIGAVLKQWIANPFDMVSSTDVATWRDKAEGLSC